MEVSRGAAYGLGLSQFAITMGIVLFSPAVEVDVYLAQARRNATTGLITAQIQSERVHMGLPVAGTAFLAAVFAMVTCKSHEQGLAGQDFQQDVLDQMGMWDALFWMFCGAMHGVALLFLCTPANAFGALLGTALTTYFLCRACAPKSQTVNLTQENLNLLGYGLGVLLIAYQVTDANGWSVLGLLVVVDYFLGIGHCYDRQATIDTVSHCRIFYICAGAIGCAVLYATNN